jgi:hypothetical protein
MVPPVSMTYPNKMSPPLTPVVNQLVIGHSANMSDEAVKDIQVLEPRVGCVATVGCDGGDDVGVRVQHEVCECAKGTLEVFDVEGEHLVRVRAY